MTGLSRRGFLKGAGATVGLLAITSLTPMSAFANQRGKGVLTAGHWGAMLVEVRDGKIISSGAGIKGEVFNSLQTTAADQVHTKARIKYPMVRKGFLDNPESPDGRRGDDEFVRVSWDEALQLIHKQHARIRESYGAESVFAGSYGWRSSGVLHKPQSLLQRYMGMAGGYSGHLGDYSTGAAQVIMPHVMGSIEVYEQQTTHPVVLENSEVVVLWGINPMNTLKIAWSSSDGSGMKFFDDLSKTNKTIIAIDPMRSETIEHFGDKAQWIAPHAGTDVALMLGVAYALVENKLHDTDFLQKYTQGYDRFEEYLLGKKDGVAKTPRWAEKSPAFLPVRSLNWRNCSAANAP